MIGIWSTPAFQLRVAGNVAINRADDLDFLIASEIGNRFPGGHQIFRALDVKFTVVAERNRAAY